MTCKHKWEISKNQASTGTIGVRLHCPECYSVITVDRYRLDEYLKPNRKED